MYNIYKQIYGKTNKLSHQVIDYRKIKKEYLMKYGLEYILKI